jgi:hypothetical protein
MDLRPRDRLFTWSNLRIIPSFACLDRFLCSITWESEINNFTSYSLPRYQSDHNPLILQLNPSNRIRPNTVIKFDKNWASQVGFTELLIRWWNSFQLDIHNLGIRWKLKL